MFVLAAIGDLTDEEADMIEPAVTDLEMELYRLADVDAAPKAGDATGHRRYLWFPRIRSSSESTSSADR